MHSPPSPKKVSSKIPPSNTPKAHVLERDELGRLEDVHLLILKAEIFVGIAHELEQDARWRGRVLMLVEQVNSRVEEANKRIGALVKAAYQRRKREARSG